MTNKTIEAKKHHNVMKSAGYGARLINQKPDWLKVDNVIDVYSASRCACTSSAFVIEDFYTNKDNGYLYFNSLEMMYKAAREEKIDLSPMKLFYYEIYAFEYNDLDNRWQEITLFPNKITNILVPQQKNLEGFDIVSLDSPTEYPVPTWSPLSCNHYATEIPVNVHCLINTFEDAHKVLESNIIQSEPGPYRIVAVYSLPHIENFNRI
jgi:hypothetical protein